MVMRVAEIDAVEWREGGVLRGGSSPQPRRKETDQRDSITGKDESCKEGLLCFVNLCGGYRLERQE